MSLVVLPLTRVNVTRVVAVKTQMSALDISNWVLIPGYRFGMQQYIPSLSPSLSAVLHPVSFVPRGLILIIIHCALKQRYQFKEILKRQWYISIINWKIIPFRASCPDPTALCRICQFLHICRFQSHVVYHCTLHPHKNCHLARCRCLGPWGCCTQILPVGLEFVGFIVKLFMWYSIFVFFLFFFFFFFPILFNLFFFVFQLTHN